MTTGTIIKIHSTEKCGCLGNDNKMINMTGMIDFIKHDKHIVFYVDKYPKSEGWQPYIGCVNCIKEVKK